MNRLLFPFVIFSILTTVSAEEWNAKLKLPFGSSSVEERVSFDIKKNFDLSATDQVRITLSVDQPEAIRSVSLYFHSGGGWYAMSGNVKKSGCQTLVFSLGERHIEDKPGGLDNIDQLRLSFWRGKNVDATVELADWEFVSHPIVVLHPNDTKSESSARRVSYQFQESMTTCGLEVGSLEQADLSAAWLQGRRVVILPLNSELQPETVVLLKQFVESGGKLFAFYLLPAELMKTLGFGRGEYVRSPEGAEAFAAVHFDSWFAGVYGEETPRAFEQRSWNITSVKPLDGADNHGAKVAAVWVDAADRPTAHPALLVSNRGAFFSHILVEGDNDRKQAVVLAILAKWYPDLWTDVRIKRLGDLYAVGETPFETVAEKTARIATIARQIKPFENTEDARKLCLQYPVLRKELAEQYIRSIPGKPDELRFWWEHAGTGPYPGDWDRTMKELRENGFTAVIPNMLWGGLAHYDSKLLPHSQAFERYGDQIEQAVRAGKKHGIEVHVWKVNFNCMNAPKEFIDAMRRAGRTQVGFDGTPGDWLCPSHPENRKLECDAMLEVAKNYDVDGIHFDYIRYPDSEHCYCNGCRERFEKHIGEKIADWPKATRSEQWRKKFDDWRCEQITALVADVHREAKKLKPSIKISAAVFPQQPESRGWVLQDWPVWVEKGYLDFICPMNYTTSAVTFDAYVENQLKIVDGRIPIYPGIGATLGISPDQTVTQISVTRKRGTSGFTLFDLNRNTIGSLAPILHSGPSQP